MIGRILLQLVGTILISLFLATRLGPAIVDISFLVPMACLAMLFVAPLVVRTGSFLKSVLIAVGMMAFSIALSLAWTGAGIPQPTAIVWALGCSLALASATAALTQLLLAKAKIRPNVVIWIMRGLMLALYLAYRTWPDRFPI